jgi:hypothetical protein
VGLLVVVAPVEPRSLRTFHAMTPWSQPARIHYCGRDYDPGGVPVTKAALKTLVAGVPLTRAMRGNHGQQIWAQQSSGELRTKLGVPCTMMLYEQRGSLYQTYVLSGGP